MFARGLRLAVGVAVLAFAFVVAPASAKQPECTAINQSQNAAYNSNNTASPLSTVIAEAASGDTIKVMGTCSGNVVIDKNLTLRGRSSLQHEDTIRGDGSHPVLSAKMMWPDPGISLTLRDLTIAGGSSGIRLQGIGNRLTGSDLTITDNTVGLDLWENVVSLTRTDVSGNEATGISNWEGLLTVESSSVTENGGTGIASNRAGATVNRSIVAGNGGDGMSFAHGDGTISNSVIEGNTTSGNGGGLALSQVFVTLTDVVVRGNTAAGDGGGIWIASSSRATIINGTITGNTAAHGGGISYDADYPSYAGLLLTDSTVTGNTATTAGGGIYPTTGGGLVLTGVNNLCGNTPDDWPGCAP